MVKFKTFEVCVLVDGEPLPEYKAENDGEAAPNILSRYVEAVAGRRFEIKLNIKSVHGFGESVAGIEFIVTVDGIFKDDRVIRKSGFNQQTGESRNIVGVETQTDDGKWTVEKFRFGAITTTSDAKTPAATGYSDLGTIRAELWRVQEGFDESEVDEREPARLNDVSEADECEPARLNGVSEVALKGQAITLGTCLEEKQEIEGRIFFDIWHMDAEPLATFIFKYRDQQSLQQLGILSRSPTPVPLDDLPADMLTKAQLLERLARTVALVETKRIQIKQEKQEKALLQLASAKRSHDSMEEGDDDVEAIAGPAKQTKLIDVVELD